MSGDSRRALGLGLLAASVGIAVLMLVWLATSGAEAGGVVLGLLLLFVLAGPLAGVGGYLVFAARSEIAAEQAFAGKRRVLDADRLFRRELAARLGQLAATPGLPAERIRALAESAGRTIPDESAWYEAVQLTDAQIALLRQYDDLVWERVRWLGSHTLESSASSAQAVEQLQRAIEQRSDLLVRGREGPRVAPSELLASTTPEQARAPVQALAVGDAVTRDGVDYVVEAVATSFADGQTWKLAHLAPAGHDGAERWLEISPAGVQLTWLDRAVEEPAPGASHLRSMPQVSSGSVLTSVVTHAGPAPPVLVRSWRYRDASGMGLVQQWPDGELQAYIGTPVHLRDLTVWPSTHTAEVAHIP
ncbi:MAG TPA: DUF4178 domain-containing protein [Chloroflexota bacterium]|jgi:hypothetical protein